MNCQQTQLFSFFLKICYSHDGVIHFVDSNYTDLLDLPVIHFMIIDFFQIWSVNIQVGKGQEDENVAVVVKELVAFEREREK